MKMCSGMCVAAAAAGLVGAGFLLAGAGQPPKDLKSAKPPTQDEIMKQMKEMGKPVKEHDWIKGFEGTWKGHTTMTDPEGKKQESDGVMKSTSVLGGRFIRQEWKGEMMGESFEGLGYMGYDRMKNKFVSTWMDSWGTGVMISEGDYDAKSGTYTFVGEGPCGPDGKPCKMRQVIKVGSSDEHTFQMFSPGPDGKEMNCMTIVYKRQK